jgi:preprotein translocase subunit SecD
VAQPTTTSKPGRLLAALIVLTVIMLAGVVGKYAFQPANWHKGFKVGLGLDLSSGTTVTLKAVSTNPGKPPSQADMTTAISIMNNRVNSAGFTGASVEQQGNDIITVAVPGKGSQQVANLVGTTAQLRFRQVLLAANNTTTPTPTPTPTPSASASPKASASPSPKASASPSPSSSPSASSKPKLSTTADGTGDAAALSAKVKAQFDKLNCAEKNWRAQIYGDNPNNWDNPKIQVVTCYQGAKYALDKSTVTGQMVSKAGVALQPNGNWWVTLDFKPDGAKAFGALTSEMFAKYQGSATNPLNTFAIVLDGTPVSIPYVSSAITGGNGQIQGTFSQQSATSLANILTYGALPLSFQKQSVQSVSAQLGASQLHAGLIAGAIGLLLVVIYSFLYYRGLGLVSVSSLAIAALLSYLSVVLLSKYGDLTMSLAGIAGLIVAIGITADSFVVFFERLRDEVRDGRTLRTAVERGWVRARRTILVSDTVSFLAAALLWKFAIGDVKGFAFTLGLTTLVDVVVVFLFTKPMVTLLARTKFYGQGHPLSGLDPARLGARSPWRGSRRPARAGPATRSTPSGTPSGTASARQARTNPKEA